MRRLLPFLFIQTLRYELKCSAIRHTRHTRLWTSEDELPALRNEERWYHSEHYDAFGRL
jgi:hypothetical protein